jgi:putative Holliday junction resolvase
MSRPQGRVLALDVGERRIGVALSDVSATLASPYATLPAYPAVQFFQKLTTILRLEEVVLVVVGLPLSLNGHEGPQAQRIRAFIAELTTHTALPIIPVDERYTSAEAQRIMIEAGLRPEQRKARIDEVAASIILQDYLISTQALLSRDE